MTKIGMALGGGGARGLAHVAALEALEDLAPDEVSLSGTSIGALLGVAWAAGHSADEIRRTLVGMVRAPDHSFYSPLGKLSWVTRLGIEWQGGGLVSVDSFLGDWFAFVGVERIEDLPHPIRIVTSDFWTREEVVFEKGPLATAVRASMSLPAIFKPVVYDGRVLVDGGCVNPVPVDRLDDDCDVTVAVDVLGDRTHQPGEIPNLVESVFNTFQIMEASIVREKLARFPPTITVCPATTDVQLLDFQHAERILRETAPLRAEVRDAVRRALAQA